MVSSEKRCKSVVNPYISTVNYWGHSGGSEGGVMVDSSGPRPKKNAGKMVAICYTKYDGKPKWSLRHDGNAYA